MEPKGTGAHPGEAIHGGNPQTTGSGSPCHPSNPDDRYDEQMHPANGGSLPDSGIIATTDAQPASGDIFRWHPCAQTTGDQTPQ